MPNDDLISRSALLSGFDVRKVTEYDESGCGVNYKAVPVEAIEAAPAVDAEPVRRAKWEAYKIDATVSFFRCSECSRIVKCGNDYFSQPTKHIGAIYPYCHCGAKMEENE